MKLYPNWREILRRSWAQRFVILAGLVVAASEVIPMFEDVIPRTVYAPIILVLLAGAFIARVVYQEGI